MKFTMNSVRVLATSIVSLTGIAYATEGGVSVYPAGVETIMPGRMPGPGETLFLEFNNFYEANSLIGAAGQSLVPGFRLCASPRLRRRSFITGESMCSEANW